MSTRKTQLTRSSSVTRWSPGSVPSDPAELPDYLQRELHRLSDTLFNIDSMNLKRTHVPPPKSRDGDMRYADGVDWNPTGEGGGVYLFVRDQWIRI